MRSLICGHCSKAFTNTKMLRYCSRKCANQRHNSSRFVAGREPWNKGTKGVCKPSSTSFTSENQLDDRHTNWKGDRVGYFALHSWVGRKLGKPGQCEHCGTTTAKRFEWANKSGEYKRDLSDWLRLCSKCHHAYDNITIRGWETRRTKA
jgi:hypothetical protein